MSIVTLTAKRQATLPAALCAEMGVSPGAQLCVEKRAVDGEMVWILKPARANTAWFGSLRRYAKGKAHDMDSIRTSIARARRGGRP